MRLNHPGSRGDQKLQHSPVALFVKFEKEGAPQEWELAGLEGQPGVYCVSKQPEYWYVDGKGVMSRGLGWSNKGCHNLLCSCCVPGGGLRVRRHQFPVAPDFSRTAYSMQGFTLPACLVDLRFDKNTDPVTGYVAMSTVKKCEVTTTSP